MSLMDELQSKDFEELVHEMEEEEREQGALSADVEELLDILQSGSRDLARRDAAEQLGKAAASSRGIVKALITACELDPCFDVRRAAARSLRAPVHQETMQRKLGQIIDAKVAEVLSFLPTGNLRYWLLASFYAPGFLGVTYLALMAEGSWRLWVAGAVWLLGGYLGLYVLSKKGHGALIEKYSSKLEGPDGSGLFLLAAVGPFVLLVALLMRLQDPDATIITDSAVSGGQLGGRANEHGKKP